MFGGSLSAHGKEPEIGEATPEPFQRTEPEIVKPDGTECNFKHEDGPCYHFPVNKACGGSYSQPYAIKNKDPHYRLPDIVGEGHTARKSQYMPNVCLFLLKIKQAKEGDIAERSEVNGYKIEEAVGAETERFAMHCAPGINRGEGEAKA